MHDPEEGRTDTGMIRTGARPREHAPAHQDVIDALIDSVAADVSVYLYGSVATGTAVIPTSDVDFLTFGLAGDEAVDLGRRLSAQAANVCREVAIASAQPSELRRQDDEGYGLRVFLRHYCVHLAGPPVHDSLRAAYPADRRAARGFNGDIALHAERWRVALHQPSAEPARLGLQIARKTLLAVAGLVSIREMMWTTDRHLAAERWAEQDPAITELATWLEHPPSTRSQVRQALDGTVARVVEAFEAEVGTW